MKLLIAVPTFENIRPETFKSIYDLDKICATDFIFIKGYDCAKARNEIATYTINNKYDYVLMVDSDIILPQNTLTCLLEDSPSICLGVYPRKNTKIQETELFKIGSSDFKNRYTYDEISDFDNYRLNIKGGGLGCCLIQADIFKKMPYPWFKFVVYNNGSVLSEDLYFCNEAKKVGISIYADLRIQCGHLAQYYQYE